MKICPSCHLRHDDDVATCVVDGTPLEAATDPRVGSVIMGRYVLESVLGEGGLARVYRARHVLVQRPYAVKVIHPHLARDPVVNERLRREARAAATIAHPNVVEIFDLGHTEKGEPFLVMELLEGRSLRTILIEEGALSVERVVALGTQIASGLARAHDLNIVHRDLKPENIIVLSPPDRPEVVKLVDFGLAYSREQSRLTAADELVGTPAYLAPERIHSNDATAATDLYALGIVLFEMVTGQPPFNGERVMDCLMAHLDDPPPKASTLVDCPRALEDLIDALLEKQPADRPVDAHQVIRRLALVTPERQARRPRLRAPGAVGRSSAASLTLESWRGRLEVFEKMVEEAHPDRRPEDLKELLHELSAAVRDLARLHREGLAAQLGLDELKATAREARERMGHEIHMCALELSEARSEVRALRKDQRAGVERRDDGAARFRSLYRALGHLGEEGAEPDTEDVHRARVALDALYEWFEEGQGVAREAKRLEQAEARVEAQQRKLDDLRAGLQAREDQFDIEAEASRQVLMEGGEERREAEQRLVELASRLRAHRTLGALIARTDTTP